MKSTTKPCSLWTCRQWVLKMCRPRDTHARMLGTSALGFRGQRTCSTLLTRSVTPLPRRLYPAKLLARTCTTDRLNCFSKKPETRNRHRVLLLLSATCVICSSCLAIALVWLPSRPFDLGQLLCTVHAQTSSGGCTKAEYPRASRDPASKSRSLTSWGPVACAGGRSAQASVTRSGPPVAARQNLCAAPASGIAARSTTCRPQRQGLMQACQHMVDCSRSEHVSAACSGAPMASRQRFAECAGRRSQADGTVLHCQVRSHTDIY